MRVSWAGLAPDARGRAQVRLALMGSGVVAFLWNYLEELTPIYISAPVERARALPPQRCLG